MDEGGGDPFIGVGSAGPNSAGGITSATLDLNGHNQEIGHPFQSLDKGIRAIGSLFQALNPGAAMQSLQSIPSILPASGKVPGLFGGKGGR